MPSSPLRSLYQRAYTAQLAGQAEINTSPAEFALAAERFWMVTGCRLEQLCGVKFTMKEELVDANG